MVAINSSLGFSPEYEEEKKRVEALREEYASLLSEYAELTGAVRKNLESEYMMTIGRKEYKLYELKVQINQLKREISIYQAAVNNGKKISRSSVKEIIEKEFAEYRCQLEEQQKKVEEAEAFFGAKKLSPEESKTIQKLYHELVYKLHPDLNPGLPGEAAVLWNRIMAAYKSSNWKELFLLADMTEEFLQGKKNLPIAEDTMEELKKQETALLNKLELLKNNMVEMKTKPPFCFEELLQDPAQVLAKRKELDEEIGKCKDLIVNLKQIREELRK